MAAHVLQIQHFTHGSSHHWDRRRELKTGAAGSGLGDLVGGTFPLSLQHDETQQGVLGSVLLQELHFNVIPSLPLVVTPDPTSCKGGDVSSSVLARLQSPIILLC